MATRKKTTKAVPSSTGASPRHLDLDAARQASCADAPTMAADMRASTGPGTDARPASLANLIRPGGGVTP